LRSGIGYDADIICKTPQSIKNRFGYFSYFISGIIFAMRLKRRRYRIELIGEREIEDGVEYNRYREIEKDASCVIIANAGNMYRNWISIGKKDRIEDGFMDIFILKTENPILFLLEIIKIVLGIKETSRIAEYIRVEKCIIRNEYCIAHIDGEKKILRKNITYRIEQKAIKIFC
jgi:diacylglycerol kinase family enzyme